MKYISLTLLNIFWMLSTLLLAITFIGVLVFYIEDENGKIYWFVYGRKLLDAMSDLYPEQDTIADNIVPKHSTRTGSHICRQDPFGY